MTLSRRGFFSGLLAAACASALRFYPAPQKPVAQVPEFPPAKVETRRIMGLMISANPTIASAPTTVRVLNGEKTLRLMALAAGESAWMNYPYGLLADDLKVQFAGPGSYTTHVAYVDGWEGLP